MFKDYLLLLLAAHLAGDFYTQNDALAKKKKDSFSWVIVHGLIYLLMFVLFSLLYVSSKTLLFAFLAAFIHFAIDALKFVYERRREKSSQSITAKDKKMIYFIDQALHLVTLSLCAYLFTVLGYTFIMTKSVVQLFETVGLPATSFLPWCFLLLFLHKPVNFSMSWLLAPYRPKDKYADDEREDKQAGRLIGTLERYIMIIFIALGQYAAIGLVLTAKSIARYDRITKEEAFAEYYLLGTLLSTLVTIAVAWVLP